MTLGERLKEERERLDMSQPKFAALAGATKQTLFSWESGKTAPSGFQLQALAKAGADVLYVVTGQRSSGVAEVELLPNDERLLVDAYRACNAEAKRNLIQTAALLSAGLAAGAPPEKTYSRGRPAMNPPLVKAGQSGSQGSVNKAGKGSVQAGHIGGHVTVTTHKGSKP